jgi:hypothetical protein
MTFEKLRFVIGGCASPFGEKPHKEIQKVQRWGIATTAHQAAKPRVSVKQKFRAMREMEFLSARGVDHCFRSKGPVVSSPVRQGGDSILSIAQRPEGPAQNVAHLRRSSK